MGEQRSTPFGGTPGVSPLCLFLEGGIWDGFRVGPPKWLELQIGSGRSQTLRVNQKSLSWLPDFETPCKDIFYKVCLEGFDDGASGPVKLQESQAVILVQVPVANASDIVRCSMEKNAERGVTPMEYALVAVKPLISCFLSCSINSHCNVYFVYPLTDKQGARAPHPRGNTGSAVHQQKCFGSLALASPSFFPRPAGRRW